MPWITLTPFAKSKGAKEKQIVVANIFGRWCWALQFCTKVRRKSEVAPVNNITVMFASMYFGTTAPLRRALWLEYMSPDRAGFTVSQLVSLSSSLSPKPHTHWQQCRSLSKALERTEATFLSVDEAPYRLREALYNKRLWKEAFLTGPDHVFTNLSDHFKPIQVWQNAFAHLIGAHNVKRMLETKKGRAR